MTRTTDTVEVHCSNCDYSFASLDEGPFVHDCPNCHGYHVFAADRATTVLWAAIVIIAIVVIAMALIVSGTAP